MFTRLLRIIERIEDGLLALMLSGMILLACLQIILRNVFDSGLLWADPVLQIMLLWLTLLGAIAASRDDKHIRIDVLTSRLAPRPRAAVNAATALFTAAVCAIIAWQAGRLLVGDYHAHSLAFGQFPAWVVELILPFGFALITLRYLILTQRHLLQLGRSD
ncbi:MAG: TRAP transporter small permease [Gammaproteobacteria bacterium]|jgi:TRAP-type C4-dicarboxylate transport system permease small subunit